MKYHIFSKYFPFPNSLVALKKTQKPLKDFQRGIFSFLSNYKTVNPALKEHFHPSVLPAEVHAVPASTCVPPGSLTPATGARQQEQP